MAINYQAMTTSTGATAAAANLAQLEALKALILTNPAWSLVEDTATVGTGSYRYIAFKCAAASSGLPNDFYVLLVFSAANSTYGLFLGETYNAATHVLSGACGGVNGSAFGSSPSSRTSGLSGPHHDRSRHQPGGRRRRGRLLAKRPNFNPYDPALREGIKVVRHLPGQRRPRAPWTSGRGSSAGCS